MIQNQKAKIGQAVKFEAQLPSEETEVEWFIVKFFPSLSMSFFHYNGACL